MRHIVSATALTSGEHLAMCGYVYPSYEAATATGDKVGNYLGRMGSFSEYHTRGVDCEACIVRHAGDEVKRSGEYITTVSGVEYPDGKVGACYALVRGGTAACMTIKRAAELQAEGVEYAVPHPVYPADFETFFGPDFPMVGEPRS